jgi:hypothetical protein
VSNHRSIDVRRSIDPDQAAAGATAVLSERWRRLLEEHPEPPVSASHDAGTGLTPAATLALFLWRHAHAGLPPDVRESVVAYLTANSFLWRPECQLSKTSTRS